jgi:hypothetical protein
VRFKKSKPIEAEHEFLFSASMGTLQNMDASPPARKAHFHEMNDKSAAFRTLANCHGPYWAGRYEEEAPHKAGVGAKHPRV